MARTQGSHSDITGPRIRQAALRLFAERGYAAVSMRQIAGAVGLQAGALYNYTADKQSLLFELMEGHLQDLLGARAREPEAEPHAALEGFVRFHIRYHIARPEEVFIAYMELRSLDAENFARIEALRRAYEDELEGILRRGSQAGVFAVEDAKVATLAVIAMLTGVNTWYRSGGRLSLEEVEDVYWTMARRAVGAGVSPAQ